MRSNLISVLLLSALFLLPAAIVRAQPISLVPYAPSSESNVTADTYSGSDETSMTSYPVTSLPFITVTNSTDESSVSNVTPALSATELQISVTELVSEPSSEADAALYVYFTANQNVTYTISGTSTVTGGDNDLSLNLFDQTSQKTIYDENPFGEGPNTFNLDSTAGPLTGPLTSGDEYLLIILNDLDTYPPEVQSPITNSVPAGDLLTGSASISFSQSATPEPASATIFAAGSLVLLTRRRLARN